MQPAGVPAAAGEGAGDRAGALSFGPVRTILLLPAGQDGSSFYRLTQPAGEVRRHTRHVIMMPAPGQDMPPPSAADLEYVDAVVCQRPAGPMGAKSWDQMKGLTRRVYEIDDDMFAAEPSGLPHMCDYMVINSMKYMMASADMITVSTPALAEHYARLNPDVRVLPNYIHQALLDIPRRATERVTIGYTGASSHLADMCSVQDPLRDVLHANQQVNMHFFGIDYSPMLASYEPLVRRSCLWSIWQKDLWDYYRSLNFDIGIAPLDSIPFNTYKSNLKVLEYAARGIPCVASDSEPYRHFVRDGETGYLVRTHDQWRKRLTELISDADARAEMGAAAKQAAAGWTIQEHWDEFERAWTGACAGDKPSLDPAVLDDPSMLEPVL